MLNLPTIPSVSNNNISFPLIVNPYWIEDRDLGPGQIDYLPGVEVQFWKDLIEKYLEPLMSDKAKEKQKANELLELRNQGDADFLHKIFWFTLDYAVKLAKVDRGVSQQTEHEV